MKKRSQRVIDPAHAPGKRGLPRPSSATLRVEAARQRARAFTPPKALSTRPRGASRHA